MLKKLFQTTYATSSSLWGLLWNGSSGTFSDGASTSPDRNKTRAVEPNSIMQEMPRLSRWAEVKYCRYLDKNLSWVSGTFDDICTYTIGAGFIPEFLGGTPEWQKEQEVAFLEWAKTASVDRRDSLTALAWQTLRAVLRENEIFPTFTFKGETPAVQLLETHVFKEPTGTTVALQNLRPNTLDGITYDETGEAIAYRTFNGEDVPPSSVLHICGARRAGELRASPTWACDINPLFDSKELALLAGTGYKYQLLTPIVMQTPPAGTGSRTIGPRDASASTADSDGNVQAFEKATGSVVLRTLNPEGVKFSRPEFPGGLYASFQESYARSFCQAIGGWPFDFTNLSNKGGTSQRAVIEKAARYAEVKQEAVVRPFLYRAAIHWFSWRIATGQTAAVDNWWKINFRFTRSPSVDMGRETNSDLTELQNGMMGIPEYFARHQQDWRTQMTQNADALGMTFEEYRDAIRAKLIGKEFLPDANAKNLQQGT